MSNKRNGMPSRRVGVGTSLHHTETLRGDRMVMVVGASASMDSPTTLGNICSWGIPVMEKLTERSDSEIHALVQGNLGLVYKFSLPFWRGARRKKEELVAAGMLGLVRAAHNWAPERGAFSTCAFFYIRGSVFEALAQEGTVHVPPNRRQSHYISPMDYVSVDGTEQPPPERGSRRRERPNGVVLEGPGHQGETRLLVEEALGVLEPQEAQVVKWRHGLEGEELSFREIAERFGYHSKQRAEQVYKGALYRIRKVLNGGMRPRRRMSA